MNKTRSNNSTQIITIISLIILVLITTSQVNALGIAPSKKILNYNDEEMSVTIRITNSDAKNLTLKVSASGDLSKYITIDDEIIRFDEYTTEKQITYKINLPSGLDPKKNSANIILTEISTEKNNNIGGLLSLTHQLSVNIPYSDKYIDGEMFLSVEEGKILTNLSIINLGSQTITKIEGKLTVTDTRGEIIFDEKINNILDFKTLSQTNIKNLIEINNPGEYSAKYILNYDNNNFEISKPIKIGDYNIEIKDAEVKNFKLGTIAKFDIGLVNYWNNEISEVYSEVIITDTNNITVGRFVSDKESINPDNDYLTAYWDTRTISSGTYNMRVIIYAGENSFVKEYKINVETESITLESNKNKYNKNRMILGVILIILSLLVFSNIIIYKKKKSL